MVVVLPLMMMMLRGCVLPVHGETTNTCLVQGVQLHTPASHVPVVKLPAVLSRCVVLATSLSGNNFVRLLDGDEACVCCLAGVDVRVVPQRQAAVCLADLLFISGGWNAKRRPRVLS